MTNAPQRDRLARGWLLHESGRHELAIQEALAHLAELPDDVDGHILLAYCQNELKRPEAFATAHKAVSLAPNYCWAHYAYSKVIERQGLIRQSIKSVHRAIELDPQEPLFFGQLAYLLIARKNWHAALASADQGLALQPTDRVCLCNRAVALRILGRYAEAARTLEIGLQNHPEDAFLHATWGWVLLARNEPRLAEFQFHEALRLDPFVKGPNPKQGLALAWYGRTWLGRRFVQWWLWDSRIREQMGL